MAKLYIFGIGGTGSRVLRSLTFLLGAGVKLPSFSEVVPIVVDADSTSGDKTETVQLMENYQRLYQFTDHTSAADPDGFLPPACQVVATMVLRSTYPAARHKSSRTTCTSAALTMPTATLSRCYSARKSRS